MKHSIEDLWNGNLSPADHCGSHNRELNELVSLLDRHHTALCRKISADDQVVLEKYVDCYEDYLLRMMEQAFCDGFSLAAKLFAEALS